ncbi:MAG: GNAT family N-acetyltransferase [Spirochaetes bacterium]|nr:GNAT family N-acetyltransferase [Spirochaetota bacterium]
MIYKENEIYYKNKIITTDEVIEKIRPGDKIFLSSGVAVPGKTLSHIIQSESTNIQDIEFIQLVALGDYFSSSENSDKFRLKAFVLGESISREIAKGKVDFIPANLRELPHIFLDEVVHVDIAIVQTSMPDNKGFVSLGVASDVAKIVIKRASIVIAEINPNMPATAGETSVHLSSIDFIVKSDLPLIERENEAYDSDMRRIGWNVSNLIEDGSTVVLHVGKIFNAIADNLKSKKDLGILTHVISDWVIDLIDAGVISSDRTRGTGGLVTTSYCLGTRNLYDYINRNPIIGFLPIAWLVNLNMIQGMRSLISILNVKKIDISGEAVVFHSGDNLLSGHESKLHFASAASYSGDGKSIIALKSIDQDGNSNIVLQHDKNADKPHSTLGLMRYVVTEYGIANIFGKSIRERVISMIEIAHPKHRENLLKQAKELNYIFPDQIYVVNNAVNYPSMLETRKTLKKGLDIKVRPIKPSDEDLMRRLYYNFSDEAIYRRYFVPKPVMPHDEMQEYVNIDYEKTISVVAIVKKKNTEIIIGEARYAYDKHSDIYEMAFLVDEQYQSIGVATFLLEVLIKTACERGIKKIRALVLHSNKAMQKVAKKLQVKLTETSEDNYIVMDFDLTQQAGNCGTTIKQSNI